MGDILMYVLSDDNSSMKENIWPNYTELMEKYPMFLWTSLNGRKMKDFGNIELDIKRHNLFYTKDIDENNHTSRF